MRHGGETCRDRFVSTAFDQTAIPNELTDQDLDRVITVTTEVIRENT